MKISQIVRISYQNLLSKKGRTFFTVFAVAIGIAAVLVLLSIGYGLQRLVERQTVGLEALRIIDVDAGNSEIIKLNASSIETLKKISGVEKVVPQINAAGKLNMDGSVIDSTILIADKDYLDLSYKSILWGKESLDSDADEIWVNDVISGLLEIENKEEILDKEVSVDLIFSRQISEKEEIISSYKGIKEKIAGVVIDQKTEKKVPIVYISLSQFPELYNEVNFSRVKVLIQNPNDLETIRSKIESYGYTTASAADTVEQISSVFTTFRIVLFIIGLVGIVISLVGMFNTLTISLLDRMREIGIMKALGMRNRDVLILFLTDSILISAIGGILGIGASFILGFGIEKGFQAISSVSNRPVVDFYYTPPILLLITVAFSFLIGVLTGFYPAYRARRTRAIDALRYE